MPFASQNPKCFHFEGCAMRETILSNINFVLIGGRKSQTTVTIGRQSKHYGSSLNFDQLQLQNLDAIKQNRTTHVKKMNTVIINTAVNQSIVTLEDHDQFDYKWLVLVLREWCSWFWLLNFRLYPSCLETQPAKKPWTYGCGGINQQGTITHLNIAFWK